MEPYWHLGILSFARGVFNGEGNEERGGKESSPKTDGFEPFVDPNDPLKPQRQEGVLFVNLYGGNYAQTMLLSRKSVEKVLQIAHLDGQVFLTSLVPSRQRSIESQGNELAAKRNLFFGEKIQEDKENPLYRIVSVPQGWRIEINDTRITEELTEKDKFSGKELQKAFIERFNILLKKGIRQSVWREKFSSEKDRAFRYKLLFTSGFTVIPYLALAQNAVSGNIEPFKIAFSLGLHFFSYGALNRLVDESRFVRNIDHTWEYFMPLVEIDKVAGTFAYLLGKGIRLVREAKEEK